LEKKEGVSKECETRYKTMVEHADEMFYIHDTKHILTYISPQSIPIFGYTPEEMRVKWTDLATENILNEKGLELTEKAINTGEKQKPYLLELKRKDGKIVLVEVNEVPVKDAEGKVIGITGALRDITEKKQTEDALKKSERGLNKAQEISHIGSWNLEIVKNVLTWSDEIYRIFGLKPQEFGATYEAFLNAIHPEDRDAVNKAYEDSLKDKSAYEIEHRIVLPNKEIRWVNEQCETDFDEKGKPLRSIGIVQDITEKMKAEKILEQYQFVIEQSTQQIAFVDLKGNITYVNEAWAKGHGYTQEELSGKNLSMFHTKEELLNVEKFNKLLMKKGHHSGEIIHKRKDGSTYPTLMSNFILKKDGKPSFLVGIAIDITEEKKAENKLKRSEKRFGDVAMASGDWIWETDKEGKYTFVSEGVKKILGYSSEEVIGKTPFDFMPEKEVKRVGEIFKKIVSEKKRIVDLENWNLTKEGKNVLLLTNGVPILDKQGNVLGYRGIDKDVTEKRKFENKLKKLNEELEDKVEERTKELAKSNLRYQTLYDSSADAIMTLEPPTWSFTSGNGATIEMFKARDEKEFTSKAPWEFSPKYQPDKQLSSVKAKAMIMKAMKEGSNYFEWTHKRLNGKDFPATVLLTKVKYNGTVLLQATVRDITKQKHDELVLKDAYKKLKTLDEMKDQFLIVTSHELKTPITPIMIQSQMLKEESLGELNEKQKKGSEIIYRNMVRLNKLISDILDFSKMRSGKLVLDFEECDLVECISKAIEDISSLADAKKISITFDKIDLAKFKFDNRRVMEVLMNLLNNAVKFTNANGEIVVSLKKEKDFVQVSVKDNGVGIREFNLDRIFEPFYQEGSFLKHHEGTGLGVPISKGIVEGHGGKIWVESVFGKGSTFYFTLPLKQVAKNKITVEGVLKNHPEGLSILEISKKTGFSSEDVLKRLDNLKKKGRLGSK
jgi:PAS domain S-box-containing protein